MVDGGFFPDKKMGQQQSQADQNVQNDYNSTLADLQKLVNDNKGKTLSNDQEAQYYNDYSTAINDAKAIYGDKWEENLLSTRWFGNLAPPTWQNPYGPNLPDLNTNVGINEYNYSVGKKSEWNTAAVQRPGELNQAVYDATQQYNQNKNRNLQGLYAYLQEDPTSELMRQQQNALRSQMEQQYGPESQWASEIAASNSFDAGFKGVDYSHMRASDFADIMNQIAGPQAKGGAIQGQYVNAMQGLNYLNSIGGLNPDEYQKLKDYFTQSQYLTDSQGHQNPWIDVTGRDTRSMQVGTSGNPNQRFGQSIDYYTGTGGDAFGLAKLYANEQDYMSGRSSGNEWVDQNGNPLQMVSYGGRSGIMLGNGEIIGLDSSNNPDAYYSDQNNFNSNTVAPWDFGYTDNSGNYAPPIPTNPTQAPASGGGGSGGSGGSGSGGSGDNTGGTSGGNDTGDDQGHGHSGRGT